MRREASFAGTCVELICFKIRHFRTKMGQNYFHLVVGASSKTTASKKPF